MENNIFKKRLVYKSANRGWKETDIILGNFVKRNISSLTDSQLIMLDSLLDESDGDIFNWVTKKIAVPERHNNEIMQMLQEFKL